MLRLCILVVLAVASIYGSPHQAKSIQNVVATITVSNGADGGTWRYEEMCPVGTYAIGFENNVSFTTEKCNFCIKLRKMYLLDINSAYIRHR